MEDFTKTNYRLQSVKSGNVFEDTGWVLDAPDENVPTLIRAVYERKQLTVKSESFGLYRFSDWLPVNRMLKGSSAPVTYKSRELAKALDVFPAEATTSILSISGFIRPQTE